jgi:hypothetical protein
MSPNAFAPLQLGYTFHTYMYIYLFGGGIRQSGANGMWAENVASLRIGFDYRDFGVYG